jgi:hypothetical protein
MQFHFLKQMPFIQFISLIWNYSSISCFSFNNESIIKFMSDIIFLPDLLYSNLNIILIFLISILRLQYFDLRFNRIY